MDILSSYSWFGEFFLPNDHENRFTGRLDYSPTSGLKLSWFMTDGFSKKSGNIIHGFLETGEACTLFGRFDAAYSGLSLKQGFTSRSGDFHFALLAIGDLLADERVFQKVDFSLSGMEEFFVSKGLKDQVVLKRDALNSWETSYGRFEVGLSAKFRSFVTDVTASVYSHEEAANEDLRSSYNEVLKRNPNACFMLRQELSYGVHLKTFNFVTYNELYNHISALAGLFSVLMCSPVYPESIVARIDQEDSSLPAKLNILPSLRLDPRTIELTKRNRSHFNMPINGSAIDVGVVAKKWLENPQRHSVMVSGIQHETGLRTEHAAHGDIVLYATQLEAVSHAEGRSSEKYAYPIRRYGGGILEPTLIMISKKYASPDAGRFVSDLRNEISHVGRPKKILANISLGDLVIVSRILQLAVIGSILHQLGVSMEVISKYMRVFCPRVY